MWVWMDLLEIARFVIKDKIAIRSAGGRLGYLAAGDERTVSAEGTGECDPEASGEAPF